MGRGLPVILHLPTRVWPPVPCSVGCPSTLALPFGTFEAALSHKVNADLAATVAKLQTELVSAGQRSPRGWWGCVSGALLDGDLCRSLQPVDWDGSTLSNPEPHIGW